MTKKYCVFFLLLFNLLAVFAAGSEKTYHITFTENPPSIDGSIQDSVWISADVATGFTQNFPNVGQAAFNATEVRLLFDTKNIYVSARLYDKPENISKQLYRRDNDGDSDIFSVQLDSYNDNRTAFCFFLSAAGTKLDLLIYNDENQDMSWNAVWEGKTKIDSLGWTAEFKIPLSQLRYDANSDVKEWGLQFFRQTYRLEEYSFWSPLPENTLKQVSAFGTLTGIEEIPPVRRLEVQPYLGAAYHTGNIGSPFSENIGADIKVGMGSNYTLTATINPDFGQVEADPASVNLSANELYLSEQRPFFMEGLDILNFGSTKTLHSNFPTMIYTRRIGRSPTGTLPGDIDSITFLPKETNILSALKISGKTQNGLSVGIFNALTQEESIEYVNNLGHDTSCVIEPLANSFIGRLKKDFNQGQSMAGLFLSSVNRNLNTDRLFEEYRSSAQSGGVDFEHRFKNKPDWVISGLGAFSHIAGSQEAITALQRSSQRYYQRPDADYLSLDSTRESLDGLAWQASIMKSEGKHILASFTWSGATPGFDVNDMGYQGSADYQSVSSVVKYANNKQDRVFKNWSSTLTTTSTWNFGGQRVGAVSDIDFFGKFKNSSYMYASLCYNYGSVDVGLTRGGPASYYLPQYRLYFSGRSDNRKKANVFFDGNYRSGISGYKNIYGGVGISYRPIETVNITLRTNFTSDYNPIQYVKTVEDDLAVATYGARYVFSNLSSSQAASSCRIEWIASPDLTFQLYVRPYITAYDYGDFYELDHAGDVEMNQYGSDVGSLSQDSQGNYLIDPDGSGLAGSFSISNPDFNYHALQTTGVIRWEFKSACIFYLVWQQDRRTYLGGNEAAAKLQYFRDYGNLFTEQAGNNLQLKLVYWLGM